MNAAEITELFIRAAEVDRKLPDTARPAKVKSMSLPFVHTDADMKHWKEEDKHEAQWAWLNPANLRLSKNDVGLWNVAMEVIKLCPNEKNRRALWAWARSEAGGTAFAKWCKSVEGISRQVGNYRKNQAILQIERAFNSKSLLHIRNVENDDFTNDPEMSDKKCMIEVWRDDDIVLPGDDFDASLRDFTWSDRRNEMRRQRLARSR